ncbi:MAG TPA: glycerate kinase [Polyangiaceae bacterium]|jgi:glycerate kinase|nr:glycerate kinase [Polyangiaceae bacterium]
MRVLVAPSSLRRSLSAPDAAAAIARGLRAGAPSLEVSALPIADGGDDTSEVLRAALGGTRRAVSAHDALGRPWEAAFVLLPDGTAVADVSSASGWGPLRGAPPDPLRASTFGTGEVIAGALDAGATAVVVGVGGSTTVDGGAGLLQALGVRWLDAQGAPLPPGGAALARLARVDTSGLDPRLAATKLVLACDVDSPLLGDTGAARVFGPQKGAGPAEIEVLEDALARFADVLARDTGVDVRRLPRAGAAGGVSGGLHAVAGAALADGADIVLDLLRFDAHVASCDLVVTAEGRLDAQTLRGKGPLRVAAAAARHGKPVIVLVGTVDPAVPRDALAAFDAIFSLCRGPMTAEQAMTDAAPLLAATAAEIGRLVQRVSR